MTTALHRTLDAVWRMESAKIIGALARMLRDVGLAEEFAQDALVTALEHWPTDGVPNNPAAWLMTTAKRRALDHLRRATQLAHMHVELSHALDAQHAMRADDFNDAVDDALEDEVAITCCA